MNWDEHRQLCRAEYKKARGSKLAPIAVAHPKKKEPLKTVSTAQIQMAKRLGINIPKDARRTVASALITEALRKESPKEKAPQQPSRPKVVHSFDGKPSPKQLIFAADLGIQDPQQYSRKQLAKLMDEKITERAVQRFKATI